MTDENGLVYMRARYYSPELKRFINADIVAGSITNAITLNRYAYANGNPVSNIDPFGLEAEDDKGLPWLGKLLIGAGAILVGAAAVAATAATGGVAAAFVSAALAGVKAATISGAVAAGVSATLSGVQSALSGDDFVTTVEKSTISAVDGFANGFMWGGISFGASRAISWVAGKTKIFERIVDFNKKDNFFYGSKDLTLWRHGKNFRIDASISNGLHYHLRTPTNGIGNHLTEGVNELIGVFSGINSSMSRK